WPEAPHGPVLLVERTATHDADRWPTSSAPRPLHARLVASRERPPPAAPRLVGAARPPRRADHRRAAQRHEQPGAPPRPPSRSLEVARAGRDPLLRPRSGLRARGLVVPLPLPAALGRPPGREPARLRAENPREDARLPLPPQGDRA